VQELKSPLLSEREAAKYLRISARTLWSLRQSNWVQPTPIGRKIFYLKENLDRFISQSTKPLPTPSN